MQGGSAVQTFNYAHDDADNRTMERVDGVRRDFYYNALNQLIGISNGPVSGLTYEWDAANRLVAINNGTHRSEFQYDGFDRRVRILEKDAGVTNSDQRLLWSGLGLVEERDGTGGVVTKRHFRTGDQVLASGSGLFPGLYFYTHDHLASGREISDSTGTPISIVAYDPSGRSSLISGTIYPSTGFAGLRRHAQSKIGLGWQREYDPDLGRWLNRDPISEAGGLNLYSYAAGDPLDLFDPSGADESRPDLLEPNTGNSRADKVINWLKSGAEKLPNVKEYYEKAKKFYDAIELIQEVKNDYQELKRLIGENCDVGDLNDPSKHTMKELRDKPREAVGIFNILNKYLKRGMGKVPGSDAVTGPATELGPQILDTGVKQIDSNTDRWNQRQAEMDAH
jgi:RHS repeat-associated protein